MSDNRYKESSNHNHTCGECVRFRGTRENGKHKCCAIAGPKDITADRKACREYWDRAQREREEKEQEERDERERHERWAKNRNNPPKPAKWERDIDYITGKPTGEIPFCPNCDEPLYNTDRCFFCGQAIEQDERIDDWNKPPEVHHMDCFKCEGKNTVEYTISVYNGHKRGHCTVCGMSFIE